MVFSKNFVRYFALKNGFFSRECQIDKSKLQKLQENIITEQKGEKNMLSGLFLRFGTIFGPILANFWVEIKACGASRAMPCDQGYPVLKNIHSYKKKTSIFYKNNYPPRCSSVANAGGRPFCHELGIGWVHIGQWIFSISAFSHELFWRKKRFFVFLYYKFPESLTSCDSLSTLASAK